MAESSPTRGPLALGLALAVLVADQVTKLWALDSLRYSPGEVVVPGLFNLVFVKNTGSAFGFLNRSDIAWQQYLFIGITLVAIAVIGYLIMTSPRHNRIMRVALGLILGGAVGNLIDRVRLGYVVDFLDFHLGRYHWPTFNVADAAITVGAFVLIASIYKRAPARRRAREK